MAVIPFFILALALLPVLTASQSNDNLILCKPRSVLLRFLVEKPFPIIAYRACPTEDGAIIFNCGTLRNKVKLRCQKKRCPPGVRCRKCRATIHSRLFPKYYTTHSGKPILGRYLFQLNDEVGHCIILEFDSDFENSGPEWFERHNFVAGCKNRVTCLARTEACRYKNPPFDMSISAQACNATLFRKSDTLSTAFSFGKCVRGEFTAPTNGAPPGEIMGTDCPARML